LSGFFLNILLQFAQDEAINDKLVLTGRGKRLYVVEVHDVKSKFDLNKVGYNINFDAKDEQIVIKGRNVCCQQDSERTVCMVFPTIVSIRVITKLPNSEQSYKGKVKTHNYINRQNQSTTGKL
jgi:hypothetical protein